MDAAPSLHPTDQTLSSYGLGKLDDRSAEAVNEHLEQCPDCRKRVAEISADSFLKRARDAQKESGKSTSGQSQAGGAQSDKAALSPAPAPPSAETLPPGLADHPDYEIKRELGRGGMGVVYLAHNTLMGRDEVLKVMGRQITERPGVLDRFLREIRAVARLRHPNIVTAYSATRVGESIVFAMEYVEGLDLSRMVKAKGPLPVGHACNFIYQAALGLQHAHEEGLVHRDIKPANLMLSRKGDKAAIKVLDFGLAKAAREEEVDGSLTSEGQALGTPDYIAPEQIIDAPSTDIRADIYSLGATLYYLLTGRPPFQAKSLYDLYQAHISRETDPLNLVRPEVPAELAALVAKMMAKDPNRRFQIPGEVAQALSPFFKKGSVAFRAPKAGGSQAGQTDAIPPEPTAASTSTQLAMDSAASAVRAEKVTAPTAPEVRWDSLIKIRESELLPDSAPPAGAVDCRPPWKSWLVIASAYLFGFFALGLIIVTIWSKSGETKVTLADDKAAKVEVNGATIEHTPLRGGPAPSGKSGSSTSEGESGSSPVGEPEVSPATTRASEKPTLSASIESKHNKSGYFEILSGNWNIEGDELVQSDDQQEAFLEFGDEEWSDYDLTLEAKKDSGSGHGFHVVFHRLGPGPLMGSTPFCWFGLGVFNNTGLEMYFHQKGGRAGDTNKDNWIWRGIDIGRWYKIRVKARKSYFECFLDDSLIFKESHSSFTHGRVGLSTRNIQARFRHIRVTNPAGKVLFEGLPQIGSAGVAGGPGRGPGTTAPPHGSASGLSASEHSRSSEARFDKSILVSAKSECGYDIGQVRRGERLVLQYEWGKWKAWGNIPTESPDAAKTERGDWCRLAICEAIAGGMNKRLAIVPAGTHENPFEWEADRDYDRIFLGMNDHDNDYASNPDAGVRYHMRITTPVGTGGSPNDQVTTTNSIGMTLKLIPAGKFVMGAIETPDRVAENRKNNASTSPMHTVRITRPFYLGVYEVTQEEYQKVMGVNPSAFRGEANLPVESVSWFDAVEFCNRLSIKEGRRPYYMVTGTEYPSSAAMATACQPRPSGSMHAGPARKPFLNTATTGKVLEIAPGSAGTAESGPIPSA